MKNIYFFISFLLLANLSFAQWNKVEQIVSPYVFSALFSGDNIFVGADSLYISRDRGLTWEAKIIAGQPVEISALFMINNRIFAGTYGEGVYQSTDNGETWQSFNSGLGAWAEYAKTFVLSGDTLFYGTDGGGIYFVKLNSSTWQSYNQNLPSNVAWTVNDLTVTNNNLVLSAGASGYYYFRGKGLAEWSEKVLIYPSGINANINTFLSIGDTVFAGANRAIFRSYDGGVTWDSVGIFGMPISTVSFVKDNKRIYAGFTRSSGNDFYVWYSDDMGDTWEIMSHEFEFLHKLFIYDNKIWAATANGFWYEYLQPTSVPPVENPKGFVLEQNYPNPFNPATKIKYSISTSSQNPLLGKDRGRGEVVTLIIYDILGNEIATLVNERKSSGEYEVVFDAAKYGLSSGVYFYQLKAGNFTQTKKLLLIE